VRKRIGNQEEKIKEKSSKLKNKVQRINLQSGK